MKPIKPPRGLAFPAVRGKLPFVGGIQVPVGLLEDAIRPAGIRIGERAAAGHHAYAKVRELAHLGEHGVRNLAEGVETLDDRIEHNHKMLPGIEVLHIPLTTLFTTDFLTC